MKRAVRTDISYEVVPSSDTQAAQPRQTGTLPLSMKDSRYNRVKIGRSFKSILRHSFFSSASLSCSGGEGSRPLKSRTSDLVSEDLGTCFSVSGDMTRKMEGSMIWTVTLALFKEGSLIKGCRGVVSVWLKVAKVESDDRHSSSFACLPCDLKKSIFVPRPVSQSSKASRQ